MLVEADWKLQVLWGTSISSGQLEEKQNDSVTEDVGSRVLISYQGLGMQ